MSPQIAYALKKLGIAVALAILGVLAAAQTDLITAFGLDPVIWGGILAAAITGAARLVEGLSDSARADKGLVQKSDVGFDFVENAASDPFDTGASFVPGKKDQIQVAV